MKRKEKENTDMTNKIIVLITTNYPYYPRRNICSLETKS